MLGAWNTRVYVRLYMSVWCLTSCLLALGVVDLDRQRPVLKLSYQVDECVVQSLLRRREQYMCGSV